MPIHLNFFLKYDKVTSVFVTLKVWGGFIRMYENYKQTTLLEFIHCSFIFYLKNNKTLFMFLGVIYQVFYYGYCKDQRNAAVIILRYTTLRQWIMRSDTHLFF